MESREIIKRSAKKKDQYWERQGLPDWWKQKRGHEKRRQETEPDYVDPDCQAFRDQAWDRRLNGCWFYNNGKPVYITGLHYFFLEWVYIGAAENEGYPSFMEFQRKLFYFIDYCIDDPLCAGLVFLTKRRGGKTATSIAFGLDLPTRSREKNTGIQSKTQEDAKDTVYGGLVRAFKKLPDFFIPTYDTDSKLKTSIEFEATQVKGRGIEELEADFAPLGGKITWSSSKETAYDGKKLHRYIGDEIFKTEGVDVRKRHNIVSFCIKDLSSDYVGKMMYTSTVEEIKGDVDAYKKFWNESNQNERDSDTQKTKTGLYRFFTGAQEVVNPDKYGYCDIDGNIESINKERERLRDDPNEYYQQIRKEPFTDEEAFMVSSSNSMFDTAKIMDRLNYLSFGVAHETDLYLRGDFVWKDGVKDTEVVWIQKARGKFLKAISDDAFINNHVQKRGGVWVPGNKLDMIVGIDPYSHDVTTDSTKASKGAGMVYFKQNSFHPEISNSFVCQYLHRPPTADLFFEDMIMMCRYFGAPALIENNKEGIIKYFQRRGYGGFLISMPGRKDIGIPASQETKQELASATEYWVYHYVHKCVFPEYLKQLLRFDITNTRKDDAVMAAGWALVGNREIMYRQFDNDKKREVSDFFRKGRNISR